MNSRFSLIALSIVIAVLSLALVITVVGGAASSVSGEAIGIEADALRRDETGSRLLAYQRPSISQDEPLSLTEPISIYLPLVGYDYVDPNAERAALMALYNSTNGDEWAGNAGWGTGATFCEWYGVTCDENGHVTILDLYQNRLSGILPPEIGNLPMLTVLRITGTAYECTKICKYSRLSDPLPPEIGNLGNLQELNLSNNRLTTLPPEIGNLASLQKLNLAVNQLTYLPPEIGNLVSLQELSLGGNGLTSLPPQIGNLVNLQELGLSGNQLMFLPPEIGNLTKLRELELGYNRLITPLPPEIGKLAMLQVLSLNNNYLRYIPPEIGSLADLRELSLGNNLSGPIPAFLSNMENLWRLDLGENPDLTCWETQEARDWALSLTYYRGPTCYFP